MKTKTLIVVGGGASGFFCAINVAQFNPSLKIIIVEKTTKLLSKVKVSGGGRCNVTHACFEIEHLLKKYPRGNHFLKKLFYQFNTQDTVNWFEKRGVKLNAESDGRMFPETNQSQTIINCLLHEAERLGVEIILNTEINELEKQNNRFLLKTSKEELFHADFVCIATGGYAQASKFKWLERLGHTIESPVPSLFTFNIPSSPMKELMGVSVEKASVKIKETKWKQEGPLLITHWGVSGPAVLKLSAFAARYLAEQNYHFQISINWLAKEEQKIKEECLQLRKQYSSSKMNQKNPFNLPQRLWTFLLQSSSIDKDLRWADLTTKQLNLLIKNLYSQEFEVKGKTTFKEEFVTCGGIKLSEIEPSTMQSKLVENLFFVGEILDIDGITGGFNFQNAWTSGFIAAKGISGKNK